MHICTVHCIFLILYIYTCTNTYVRSMFEKQDFDNLVDYVDAFSLMTYDYSNPEK